MKSDTRRYALSGVALVIVLASLAAPAAQPPDTQRAPVLTVPRGFVVERVAGPPLVNRPIVADFDEEGRLYVADSSGSNDRVAKQLADKPHRIVRLEDTDGDGQFDASTVFADRMMFPEGAMWFAGSLYVAAPPSIWRLTDTDGDGVADRREEWFKGLTLTGCANDLHGPYLGPDGWIYWTKGAFAEQTYDRPGKAPLVTRASHIFRRRPGDAAVDVVMTGGMDNPVDVAFTPGGQRILTATFVEHPQMGRRDGLLHAVYGGVYGKPHAVIDGHKRTGDLMPVMAELGPAVPAGLTRYASRAFGEGFRDNFFAAMFNLRKVTRHVLEPAGATFDVRSSDFVVSENRDFHPTDVIEDADGSLLVIDTGPWFTLCCPTSQLAKPDVLGGIYRVRRTGAPNTRDPRGRALAWSSMPQAALAALLGDVRPAVQERAVRELALRGSGAAGALVSVIRESQSVDARRNAVWALTRFDGAEAREAVRDALLDLDESVRQAALHSTGLWRDAGAVSRLIPILKTGGPSLQRAAAESLGRVGEATAVPELIASAASSDDRVLEHSIVYALIEINDPAATAAAGLHATAAGSRRAALLALDQMDSGTLDPSSIIALLSSTDRRLEETAWWIVAHRPQWGDALATFFRERLSASNLSPSTRDDLQQRLAQFGENPAIQDLLAATVERGTPRERAAALRAMAVAARTRMKVLPSRWIVPLLSTLASRDDELSADVFPVLRAAPAPAESATTVHAGLLRLGRDATRTIEVRLEALASMTDGLAVVDPDTFELLLTGLEPARAVSSRSASARVLAKGGLDERQRLALARSLSTAGPLELPHLLLAFGKDGNEAVGRAMIAALRQREGRSSVRADLLRPVLAKYPASVQAEGDALLEPSSVDAPNQANRLAQLLAEAGGGDVRRGQEVFNSTKAACYSCHAIGYMGGKLGPDLTRIGQVRSERDLMEAIAFPSASFARGYEPVTVRTRSGELRSGVLRSDLPDEVVLATSERDEVRLTRREIADLQPGTVSLMPPGLDEQLTRQELADLLAFLKAARPRTD